MPTIRSSGKILLICAAGLLILSFLACGKKGDPIPPRLVPPPAVTDLKVWTEKGFTYLVWRMPDGKMDIDRIRILRSDLEIAGDDCPGCPRTYVQVEDLFFRDSKIIRVDPERVRYVDEGAKAGHLYTYKVVLCDSYGNCGRDSNTAEIKLKD